MASCRSCVAYWKPNSRPSTLAANHRRPAECIVQKSDQKKEDSTHRLKDLLSFRFRISTRFTIMLSVSGDIRLHRLASHGSRLTLGIVLHISENCPSTLGRGFVRIALWGELLHFLLHTAYLTCFSTSVTRSLLLHRVRGEQW
jgi:hypothetical protein